VANKAWKNLLAPSGAPKAPQKFALWRCRYSKAKR